MSNYEELKKQLSDQRLEAAEKRLRAEKNIKSDKSESGSINISEENSRSQYNEEDKTDNYNMDEKWQRVKRLTDKIEPRLYKFIFKETRDASIDARNYLNELRKLCISLRASILSQREDNDSKY